MSKKRQRESNAGHALVDANDQKRRKFSERDQKLAKLYDSLADESANVRLDAAKDLLLELAPEATPTSESLERALRRLIRGLCSHRKGARFGFFIALTELLRQLFGPNSRYHVDGLLTLGDLFDVIEDATRPKGETTGQEKRDHHLGRMSAYKALLQSGVVTQSLNTLDLWKRILDSTSFLSNKVPWLREECALMLCDAIRNLPKDSAAITFVDVILEKQASQKLLKTPEGVAIWITIQSTFPEYNSFPKKVWEHNDPLHASERPLLLKAMRDQALDEQETGNDRIRRKGSAPQPFIPFSWIILFDEAIHRTNMSRKAQKSGLFQKLWHDLVDRTVFAEKSSMERKSWGFQLFSKMMLSAPLALLPDIFSRNLIESLVHHRRDDQKTLHEASMEALKKMRQRVTKEPASAEVILVAMMAATPNVLSERNIAKALEEVLAEADDESLTNIIHRLGELIMRPSQEEQASADRLRQAVADLLLNSVRKRDKEQLKNVSPSWLQDTLVLYLKVGYCTPKSSANDSDRFIPPISPANQELFRSRLSSIMNHLLSSDLDDPSHWSCFVAKKIHSLTKSSKPYELAFDADRPVLNTIKQARQTLELIAKSNNEQSKSLDQAFRLLLSLSLLQAYGGDGDAVDVLDEAQQCYASVKSEDDPSKAFNALVEILLSFLAKPSALFRNMAKQTFSGFASSITEDGLHSLMNILQQSESLYGQQQLFDREGTPGSEAEDDNSGDEMDSDVEMVDANDQVNEQSTEESEDDEDDEDDDDDDDDDEEEVTKFEKLLAETLNTSKPRLDANGDVESSDDESMDDEQMMALEPALVKIFKERQEQHGPSKKKEKQGARETVIHFKMRVLDLLEVYVQSQPGNALAMVLLLPLIQLMRSTKEQSLSNRAAGILKAYYGAVSKQKALPTPEDDENAWALLETIHTEAQRSPSKMHGAACSRASLFIVRVLVSKSRDNYAKAVDVYSQTQKEWFKKPEMAFYNTFFTEWVSWSLETRKQGHTQT